jgi:SNF2 family DNA or RNA helicase
VNIIELSGTFITRDTGDAYVPLAAAWPLDSPNRKRFVKRYLETADTEYGEVVEGLARLAEPEFRTVLLGSMRRVSKADVLTQLPPKIYSVRYVDIPREWRKAYDGMEADMLAELPGSDDEIPAFDTLTRFGRLSQLACSAADVMVTEELDELTGLMKKHYEVTLKAPSWKAGVLLEILAERPGHPVAVFAPSRQLIEIAGEYCEKAGYRTGYVTGTTPRRERTAAIDGFQAGQLDVIAVTTGAGGTGITLTTAGTAVFLQRPWLGESIQSEDRVHRWGSEIHEHGVEIIDIVARDTIDSRRRDLLKEHAGQLGAFVEDMRLVRGLLGGLKS